MKKYTNNILIILISFFAISITPVEFQNDTYYTIKIGETISEKGIDFKDNFSWHDNLIYTYPHWLYDYITYIVYDNFSLTGIYIMTVILSITLGISLYLVSANLSRSKVVAFFLTILTLIGMSKFIAARAQLITFILFIWQVFSIEKYLETKQKRYIALLIIIPLLIANLHSAVFYMVYILYLPYIAEYLVTKIIKSNFFINKRINKLKKLSNKKENKKACLEKISYLKKKKKQLKKTMSNPHKIQLEENKNTLNLIIIMIISFFTGLLTPLKLEPYTHLIKLMIGTTTEYIQEHQPTIFAENMTSLIPVLIFIIILIFTKVKIKLRDLFMFTGLTILMITSSRQTSLLLIIGINIIAKLIVDIIPKEKLYQIEKDFNKKTIISLTIIIYIGISLLFLTFQVDKKFISKEKYPIKAADYILNNLDIENIKIYNEYSHGSYLLYRGIPVFIDSRADLYSKEFNRLNNDIFKDSFEIYSLKTNYDNKFSMYNITHILVSRGKDLNTMIKSNQLKNKEYKIIYEDTNHILYERLSKY